GVEIRDVFDDARAYHQVCVDEFCLIDARQRASNEPERVQVSLFSLRFAERDHLGSAVNPHHATAQRCQLEAENAAPAAHVERESTWGDVAREDVVPNLEALLELTCVLVVFVKLPSVVREEADSAVGL